MSGTVPGKPFDAHTAREVARAACHQVGVPDHDIELMRFGENGLFRLRSAHLVVRVARSAAYLDRVRREVAVAQWLAAAGFPAVRLAVGLPQADVVAGFPVTYWEWLPNTGQAATNAHLGELLHKFHHLADPPRYYRLTLSAPCRAGSKTRARPRVPQSASCVSDMNNF